MSNDVCLHHVQEIRRYNITRAQEKIRAGESARDERLLVAVMDRILEAVSAPTEGGVVMPATPTKEMLEASAIEWTRLCHGYPPEPGHYKFMTALWKAMLAAAPAALRARAHSTKESDNG